MYPVWLLNRHLTWTYWYQSSFTRSPFLSKATVYNCFILILCFSRCHDFRRSRSLSSFGRRSTVDVTGFLANPLFIFHLFCVCITHLASLNQWLVYYLTLCSPCCVCEWLFIEIRSVFEGSWCYFVILSFWVNTLITHICCPAPDSLLQLHTGPLH